MMVKENDDELLTVELSTNHVGLWFTTKCIQNRETLNVLLADHYVCSKEDLERIVEVVGPKLKEAFDLMKEEFDKLDI